MPFSARVPLAARLGDFVSYLHCRVWSINLYSYHNWHNFKYSRDARRWRFPHKASSICHSPTVDGIPLAIPNCSLVWFGSRYNVRIARVTILCLLFSRSLLFTPYVLTMLELSEVDSCCQILVKIYHIAPSVYPTISFHRHRLSRFLNLSTWSSSS